jgi:peptide-methionine (S)-S-oxide reductase
MLEQITLGGGCFWCLEAVFQQVQGVTKVRSGYMGGQNDSPTYEQICQGNTGHAEVVHIEFDANRIGIDNILDVFFAIHDPTTLNRQGHDVGTQYRSVVFASNANQLNLAQVKIKQLQSNHANPIVTEVLLEQQFWPAEIGHEDYYNKHPFQPYCRAVIEPKVRKFLTTFAQFTK